MPAFTREEFVRFRIGVGHPKDGHTVIEHVLGRPYGEEIERIEAARKYTADSVERALETTVDKAMNEFNPKRGDEDIREYREGLLYVHGSLLWIRVKIRLDSKNYSAVVKSKIGYCAEQVIAIG